MEYFTTKLAEGFPTDEVRKWRVSMVTNYNFRDGRLKGFNIGASARWQDKSAIGYPVTPTQVRPDIILPVGDVSNPYWGEEVWSYDLNLGYSRKLSKGLNWDIKINLRNLQNISNDELSILVVQPDGSPGSPVD